MFGYFTDDRLRFYNRTEGKQVVSLCKFCHETLINFTRKFHNQSEPSERNNKFLFFVLNIPMENYGKDLLFCNFTYVDRQV